MNDIVIKNVCKTYGSQQVLNDVNLTIVSGKVNCLMGESGIGKTTLARILLSLEKPDSGEIQGEAIYSCLFQENRLLPELSVKGNLCLVEPKGVRFEKDTLLSYLKLFGLSEDILSMPAETLSGGQQRRIALIRSLLVPFDCLILDEPFKGLDSNSKQIVIDSLLKLTKDKTVLLITHDQEDGIKMNAHFLQLTKG